MTLCTIAAAAAISGCGSSGPKGNGVAAKSPEQILSAAKKAADEASTVHVAGTVSAEGLSLELDLAMVQGEGAKGKVSEGGLSFELVRIGNTAYISGSPSFYERFGGAEAAKLLKGKWLKAPATSGQFATLGSLTDLRQLLDPVFAERANLKKGSITKLDGHEVIALNDARRGDTLYVATTGKPYPIEIKGGKGSTASGTVTFSSWDTTVKLKAPAESIDITKLQQGT